jgi:predicted enzyme related to lactoylglutathione lyase
MNAILTEVSMQNPSEWFEIPVSDIERATAFYSCIFRFEMLIERSGGSLMGSFCIDDGVSAGPRISTHGMQTSCSGVLACLSGGNDLDKVLKQIRDAGGEVIVPKTMITREFGYFGVFLDTEGNRLVLHSRT